MTIPPDTDMAQALRELATSWRAANPHGTDKPMTVGARIAYTWCAEQVEDLLAAHESRAQPESVAGWQPMETAPKDGSRISVFAPSIGYPITARWVDYLDDDSNQIAEWSPDVFPTHWMPIPAAPQPPAKDAGHE